MKQREVTIANSCSSYISQVDKSLFLFYTAFKRLRCTQLPHPSSPSQGEMLLRCRAGLEWTEILQISAWSD